MFFFLRLSDFQEVEFEDTSQQLAIASKIKSVVGDSSSWNASTFSTVASSLDNFEISDLQEISSNAVSVDFGSSATSEFSPDPLS